MKLLKTILLAGLAALLVSCITEEDRIGSHRTKCEMYGYTPGTPSFARCVQNRESDYRRNQIEQSYLHEERRRNALIEERNHNRRDLHRYTPPASRGHHHGVSIDRKPSGHHHGASSGYMGQKPKHQGSSVGARAYSKPKPAPRRVPQHGTTPPGAKTPKHGPTPPGYKKEVPQHGTTPPGA